MKTKLHKNLTLLVTPLAVTLYAGMTDIAEAQRQQPSRDERREQRREEIEKMTPEQREQYFRTRRQERERTMTPEQRQRMQEWRERMQAQGGQGGGWGGRGQQQEEVDVMANAGITDPAVKDAIRAFVIAQQEARQPLLEMARGITIDLGKPEIKSEQIAARMKEFRDALVIDQKRYETALQELDTKIGYTKNPRLEAFLTMAGVLGYEAPQVGGSVAIFANLPTPAKTATPAGPAVPGQPAAPVAAAPAGAGAE